MWKKSRRFDVFTAKTRNVKRKLDGNSVNYMEKLLDEVETKRVKKSTVIDKEKHDPEKLTENLINGKNGQKDDNVQKEETTVSTSPKVMTLEIHGNRWKVGTEN